MQYAKNMTYINVDGEAYYVVSIHRGYHVAPLGSDGQETTFHGHAFFEDEILIRTMIPATLKVGNPGYLSAIYDEALIYAHTEALMENMLRKYIKDEKGLAEAVKSAHRFAVDEYNRASHLIGKRAYEEGHQDGITESGIEDWDYGG